MLRSVASAIPVPLPIQLHLSLDTPEDCCLRTLAALAPHPERRAALRRLRSERKLHLQQPNARSQQVQKLGRSQHFDNTADR